MHSNETLVTTCTSSLLSTDIDSSVGRVPAGNQKPIAVFNICKGKNNLLVAHWRLVTLVDFGSMHSIIRWSHISGISDWCLKKEIDLISSSHWDKCRSWFTPDYWWWAFMKIYCQWIQDRAADDVFIRALFIIKAGHDA